MITRTVRKYLSEIGRLGGRVEGDSKLRGDRAYYARISHKAHKAKRAKAREAAAQ